MKKIISLFKRDYDGNRQIYDEVVEGAEWVRAGEGVATQKYDGTAVLVRDGKLFKRYTVKKFKTPPPDFEAASDMDPKTGKQEGWVPVGNGPDDKWYNEAFGDFTGTDGTYELCGPKIQGNPEHYDCHILIYHGEDEIPDAPRTFDELREWFKGRDIEGIVWWHFDGRMVKIKAKDFGLRRECE